MLPQGLSVSRTPSRWQRDRGEPEAGSEEAYAELARYGCDQAQGFYLSRPVPAAELEHWLSTRSAIGEFVDSPQLLPFAAFG